MARISDLVANEESLRGIAGLEITYVCDSAECMDLEALVDLGHSRRAGIIFLTILGVSMLCMITTSFLNILAPG